MCNVFLMLDQYKKVKEFVRVAQEDGATLVCGGKRPDVSPSLAFSLCIFEFVLYVVGSYDLDHTMVFDVGSILQLS